MKFCNCEIQLYPRISNDNSFFLQKAKSRGYKSSLSHGNFANFSVKTIRAILVTTRPGTDKFDEIKRRRELKSGRGSRLRHPRVILAEGRGGSNSGGFRDDDFDGILETALISRVGR